MYACSFPKDKRKCEHEIIRNLLNDHQHFFFHSYNARSLFARVYINQISMEYVEIFLELKFHSSTNSKLRKVFIVPQATIITDNDMMDIVV
jgi:hypothetical protein